MPSASYVRSVAPLLVEQFPDYPTDDLPVLPHGFEDQSWANDSCPSFFSQAHHLTLWVDYADPAKREYPECDRFALRHEPRDHEAALDLAAPRLDVYVGDDWAALNAALEAFRSPPGLRRVQFTFEGDGVTRQEVFDGYWKPGEYWNGSPIISVHPATLGLMRAAFEGEADDWFEAPPVPAPGSMLIRLDGFTPQLTFTPDRMVMLIEDGDLAAGKPDDIEVLALGEFFDRNQMDEDERDSITRSLAGEAAEYRAGGGAACIWFLVPAPGETALCAMLERFCDEEGLEMASADEMVFDPALTVEQRTWLMTFCAMWDANDDREDFRDGALHFGA